jgi:hypothetical protein
MIGGGLSVGILWQIIYISLAVMLFVIIPFAFFFYESDVDPYAAHTPSFDYLLSCMRSLTHLNALVLMASQ